LLAAQVRRGIQAINRRHAKPIQVWSFAPDVPYLVGAFGEECFVYYCVDEYTRFQGFDSKQIAAAEDELIDRADMVITTSEPLMEAKKARRPDVVLVRHGVDFDHFARAWRSTPPRPMDLANVPGPIFGFFGLIHHWVDLALLAEVARRRPCYSFVLIGDCKSDVSELQALENVYLLGRRPYEELPAYCAAFDAGMLLFTRNAMTRSVNPVKMYEYLAAGLRVISTPLPEARRFEGPIILTDTAEAFADACDQVLAERRSNDTMRISGLVQGETWASKVEYLSKIVKARTDPQLRVVSVPRDYVQSPRSDQRKPVAAAP
jgi:glycosyltransferase involved in cell wall biosynthesis